MFAWTSRPGSKFMKANPEITNKDPGVRHGAGHALCRRAADAGVAAEVV